MDKAADTPGLKYFQRDSLAIEVFFSRLSAETGKMPPLSRAEIIDLVWNATLRQKISISRTICTGLRELADTNTRFAESLPRELADIALRVKRPEAFLKDRQICRFFEWLQNIQQENERRRINWRADLKNIASHIGELEGALLVGLSMVANQRVTVSGDKDRMILRLAERDWGSAAITFPGAEVRIESLGGKTAGDLPPGCGESTPASLDLNVPIIGYLFWLEGDALPDGRFRFGMVIDTEFSGGGYSDRLLRDEHWMTVSFTCGAPSAELSSDNVAARVRLLGLSARGTVHRCCDALMTKSAMLDPPALTPDERGLLPLASLLIGAEVFYAAKRRGDGGDAAFDQICDTLDNRYAAKMMKQFFEDCGAEVLSKQLDTICGALEEENMEKAEAAVILFAREYEKSTGNGSAGKVLNRITERFLSAYSDCPHEGLPAEAEKAAARWAEDIARPELERMGFTGEYPFFSRKKQGSAAVDYVSVTILPLSERPSHGLISFDISLSAGRVRADTIAKMRRAGLDPDHLTASDLAEFYRDSTKRSGTGGVSLGDALGLAAATVAVDVLADGGCEIFSAEPEKLRELLKVYARYDARGRLPLDLSARRARRILRDHLETLALDALPLPLIMMIAALIFLLRGGYERIQAYPHTALYIAGAGALLFFFMEFIRKLFNSARRLF